MPKKSIADKSISGALAHRAAKALFTALALLAAGAGQAGEIYKWRDAEGRIHFGDKPPAEVAESKLLKAQNSSAYPGMDIQILTPIIKRYEVFGKTHDELNDLMQKNAPLNDVTQQKHWGLCHRFVDWDVTFATEEKLCRIHTLSLWLHTSIDLPHWVDRNSAPYDLRRKWERFERDLRSHEEGHRDHGQAAIYDLDNQLRAVAAKADWAALSREISALDAKVREKYLQIDAAYDQAVVKGTNRRSAFW
ncbi:MAG: DUF922 domain-containing protein [Sulfuricella sp.]|nr:DUF922 domain-containing protein [Sulfuricella sp.]